MTSLDETADETITDTDGPVGCEDGPMIPGQVCHHVEPLPLPDDCTPKPVLIADLDQDGRGDVIVACDGNGPLIAFLGMNEGYGPMLELHPDAGPDPRDLVAAQLDGQGGLDVVVVNAVSSEGVRVYYNGPQATLTGYSVEGLVPTSVAVGPWFGEEGLPDLFVTLATDEIRPLANDDFGEFMAGAGLPVAPNPLGLVLGDLDSEDGVDVAVVSEGMSGMDGELRVIFGDGGGGLAGPWTPYPDALGTRPNAVILVDLDMNNALDIVQTRGGPGRGLKILHGNGMGDFVETPLDVGEMLLDLASGDFNADGTPDLVLSDGVGELIFLIADGNGVEPWDHQPYALGVDPFLISAGYIDADGYADVVVSVPSEDEVLLFQSSP